MMVMVAVVVVVVLVLVVCPCLAQPPPRNLKSSTGTFPKPGRRWWDNAEEMRMFNTINMVVDLVTVLAKKWSQSVPNHCNPCQRWRNNVEDIQQHCWLAEWLNFRRLYLKSLLWKFSFIEVGLGFIEALGEYTELRRSPEFVGLIPTPSGSLYSTSMYYSRSMYYSTSMYYSITNLSNRERGSSATLPDPNHQQLPWDKQSCLGIRMRGKRKYSFYAN